MSRSASASELGDRRDRRRARSRRARRADRARAASSTSSSTRCMFAGARRSSSRAREHHEVVDQRGDARRLAHDQARRSRVVFASLARAASSSPAPRMPPSGFLISCARPAAIRPKASKRSRSPRAARAGAAPLRSRSTISTPSGAAAALAEQRRRRHVHQHALAALRLDLAARAAEIALPALEHLAREPRQRVPWRSTSASIGRRATASRECSRSRHATEFSSSTRAGLVHHDRRRRVELRARSPRERGKSGDSDPTVPES